MLAPSSVWHTYCIQVYKTQKVLKSKVNESELFPPPPPQLLTSPSNLYCCQDVPAPDRPLRRQCCSEPTWKHRLVFASWLHSPVSGPSGSLGAGGIATLRGGYFPSVASKRLKLCFPKEPWWHALTETALSVVTASQFAIIAHFLPIDDSSRHLWNNKQVGCPTFIKLVTLYLSLSCLLALLFNTLINWPYQLEINT